jgi:hypothetical protein
MSADHATTQRQYNAAIKASNAANKKAVFDSLEKEGVISVTVTFDGEGDSGQIDNVCFETPDVVTCPSDVSVLDVQWLGTRNDARITTIEVQKPIRDAIEDLCYFLLGQDNGGWENNDGAYGEFTFNVAERTIDLNFNARFTDSTHSSYSY